MEAAPASPEFWDRRYHVQASWTTSIRKRAYALADLSHATRVLEVGSGTGVITADLRQNTPGAVHGVDIDLAATRFAHIHDQRTRYVAADGAYLPYPASIFSVTAAHFLLMWVSDPLAILREMVRVTRSGGWLLCLAEPDYGGRIDYPPELEEVGQLQSDALRRQGADPCLGRRLRELFAQAGVEVVRSGALGGEWTGSPAQEDLESEWSTLETDLEDIVPHGVIEKHLQQDAEAWQSGSRVLYVPTFYAFGRKPVESISP